jgi:probable rRNA maturation factor
VTISFYSEGIHFDLKQKIRHKQWVRDCIHSNQKIQSNISFIFISNEQLRLMNREYLNHNYFTDVLTFNYAEKDIISGDIFISIEQVRINAELFGVVAEEELRRVMIHGVLHLMGFSDSLQEEQAIMRKKENEALHLWLKPV